MSSNWNNDQMGGQWVPPRSAPGYTILESQTVRVPRMDGGYQDILNYDEYLIVKRSTQGVRVLHHGYVDWPFMWYGDVRWTSYHNHSTNEQSSSQRIPSAVSDVVREMLERCKR